MNTIKNTQKITAIVCAFNEEKTIRGVMDALLASAWIDEVIAVDDASVDGTARILTDYQHLDQVKLIMLPENRGKGYGMSSAAARASGDVLCFVDADLINLSEEHIALMVETFFTEEADMLLGSPIRGKKKPFLKNLDPFLTLTGERVLYRKDFLQMSDEIFPSGYGVETLLNEGFREQGKRVHLIFLPCLIHPRKFEKTTLLKALDEFLVEGKEILAAIWKKEHSFWKSVLLADHRNFD